MALTTSTVLALLQTPHLSGLVVLSSALVGFRGGSLALLSATFILAPALPVTGLANALATIHPLLTVITYGVVTCGALCQTTWVPRYQPIGVALVLGGWWAAQEFTWGGWWNWDEVEVPLLVVGVVLSQLLHYPKYQYAPLSRCARLLLLLTSSNILCVRYLGSGSVHAFVSTSSATCWYGLSLASSAPQYSALLAARTFTPTQVPAARYMLVYYVGGRFVQPLRRFRLAHLSLLAAGGALLSLNWKYGVVFRTTVLQTHTSVDQVWLKPVSTGVGGVWALLGGVMS